MEHRIQRKHTYLNSDTDATNEIHLKEQKKKNIEHMKKRKHERESGVALKWAIPEFHRPTRPKHRIFTKENPDFYYRNFWIFSCFLASEKKRKRRKHVKNEEMKK